jgi:cytochrome c551/c552
MILNADWRNDYEVAKGFRLDLDSQGFHFPTSICFVPNPGTDAKSPLYFITEIRGSIRVVTNDRQVHTFAEDFFTLDPVKELPAQEGEIGMGGLSLYPEKGYIFVSYAYQDDEGIYRNGISRFTAEPNVFGLKPFSHTEIAPILKNFLSSVSHQIGPLAIHKDYLYVSVGDGEVSSNARDLDTPNGKILRMTLDGLPAPGNPHAVDSSPNNIRNYIWASGLRNPFSLKIFNDRVFVNDNGPEVDRFIEVNAGNDYLYDGSNDSISMNTLFLWRRAVSPVQMDFNPGIARKLGFSDDIAESVIIALSGSPIDPPGKSDHGTKSVVAMKLDPKTGKVDKAPSYLLRYRGNEKQMPVGLAYGPDALYIAPLLPDSEGNSPILRLTYSPDDEHPHIINNLNPAAILYRYSCTGCHVIDGLGVGTVGPEIKRYELGGKILKRLNSQEYKEQLNQVDSLTVEPFVSHLQARDAVRNANGKEKARTWLVNRLKEPRFDQKDILMPNLGITDEEAEVLADWLLDSNLISGNILSTRDFLKQMLPTPGKKYFAFTFILGIFAGAFSLILYRRVFKK